MKCKKPETILKLFSSHSLARSLGELTVGARNAVRRRKKKLYHESPQYVQNYEQDC